MNSPVPIALIILLSPLVSTEVVDAMILLATLKPDKARDKSGLTADPSPTKSTSTLLDSDFVLK